MAKTNWQQYKLLREAADVGGMDAMSPGAMALGNKMAARMRPPAPMADGPTDSGAALGDKMKQQVVQQVVQQMSAAMKTGVTSHFLKSIGSSMTRDRAANMLGPDLFKKAVRMGVMQVQGDSVQFNI